MIKRTLLFAVILTAVLFAAGCGGASSGGISVMSGEELSAHLEEGTDENIFYVDVREPDEFEESRIPGFENIPMAQVMSDPSVLPDDKDLILICRTQNRSMQVAESLEEQGIDPDRMTVVEGGVASYPGEKE